MLNVREIPVMRALKNQLARSLLHAYNTSDEELEKLSFRECLGLLDQLHEAIQSHFDGLLPFVRVEIALGEGTVVSVSWHGDSVRLVSSGPRRRAVGIK